MTELISVQGERISQPFFEYLRSALQSLYLSTGGSDYEFLMVSSPNVLDFEIFVTQWALKLI